MTILSVSISHHTASIDQLAQLSMSRDACREFAGDLIAHESISEALVISTCNRTEVHVETNRFHAGLDAVIDLLAATSGYPTDMLMPLCGVRYDEAAVAHCFSMVAGLDSLVVGENQVLGQARLALSDAQQAHTSGPMLNAVFQTALRVGKRVHSETAIGSAGRSVFSAALDALDAAGVAVDGVRCLVVGAGQMSGLAARSLAQRGARVTCVNRTHASAERLAREIGGDVVPFADLAEAVPTHEVVVTCTGSAGFLIDESMVAGPGPRAIVDLALPADVAPGVGDHLLLVNLASLADRLTGESVDVEAARQLVHEELAKFLARQRAATVTPTVVALRQKADAVVEAEIARLDRRLPHLDPALRNEMVKAIHRTADKLMHPPTVAVRQAAESVDPDVHEVDYAAVLRTLFALEDAS